MTSYLLQGPMRARLGGGSVFSEGGECRYALWQDTSAEAKPLVFIALNPSTATGDPDDGDRETDNTSRRFRHFARALGPTYGTSGYLAVNAFALIATDPSDLRHATDPVGPLNDDYVRAALSMGSPCVIAAWGLGAILRSRHLELLTMARALGVDLYALRLTKHGHPEHPLYLPGGMTPQLFAPARGAPKGPQ